MIYTFKRKVQHMTLTFVSAKCEMVEYKTNLRPFALKTLHFILFSPPWLQITILIIHTLQTISCLLFTIRPHYCNRLWINKSSLLRLRWKRCIVIAKVNSSRIYCVMPWRWLLHWVSGDTRWWRSLVVIWLSCTWIFEHATWQDMICTINIKYISSCGPMAWTRHGWIGR